MKKVLIAAAAAGLMSLAACTPAANNTVEANVVDADAGVYNDADPLANEGNVVEGNVVEGNVAEMNAM